MGVEAATMQRILRHSSISVTTGTYVDVIEQVQRAAVAGMDSLLRHSEGDRRWLLSSKVSSKTNRGASTTTESAYELRAPEGIRTPNLLIRRHRRTA
jgi:hypothetical protein